MLEDIISERRKKLDAYRKAGFDPYPASVKREFCVADIIRNFLKLEKSRKPFFLAGRIVAWRDQGKIMFGNVSDESGTIQAVCKEKDVRDFKTLKETIDLGDFAEIRGRAFTTERGEKSVLAKSVRVIAKSLRPLPSRWHGLEDAETRLRKRYLEMIASPETKELFVKRSVFWEEVRHFLKSSGFTEVETPVLENVPGGAEAEPFVTHHNALNRDFYLRISLELPLKKLLVGGFEKVFEIGRIFRNEGIDREHLQDYTQMECYWAYADYKAMMRFTEALYKSVIKKVIGKTETVFGKTKIKWGKKWPLVDYYEIFKSEAWLDLHKAGVPELQKKAKELGLKFEAGAGRGRLIDLIYKKTVRPKLMEPCFLINPPVDVEPLAKRLAQDKNRVERFQIMACGTELGKGFSELNDPIDQRKRFEEQMKLREAGDKEAQRIDEDFLEALEYGCPPAAGFGMSERFFAVLMDKPVRETVIFPLMKEQLK